MKTRLLVWEIGVIFLQIETESAELCPCCHSNVNDIAHALFSCSAFGVNDRVSFYNSVSQLRDDNFSSLSFSEQLHTIIKSGFFGRIRLLLDCCIYFFSFKDCLVLVHMLWLLRLSVRGKALFCCSFSSCPP